MDQVGRRLLQHRNIAVIVQLVVCPFILKLNLLIDVGAQLELNKSSMDSVPNQDELASLRATFYSVPPYKREHMNPTATGYISDRYITQNIKLWLPKRTKLLGIFNKCQTTMSRHCF